MLDNVYPRSSLLGLARIRARSEETISVPGAMAAEYIDDGWQIQRTGKVVTRLYRPKPAVLAVMDRFWALFFKMEFSHLSNEHGISIAPDRRSENSEAEQIPVFAVDDELVIAMRFRDPSSAADTAAELSRFSELRQRLAKSVQSIGDSEHKRQVVLAYLVEDVEITREDREFARSLNIVTFDLSDLEYYEKLASHIGAAAKYQLFADMLPGKAIPGLEIKVPAVKTKMGKYNCYTFPISPEYLLKISYVSHRSKGKASDVHTYQRMVGKNRLSQIRKYISEQGIFPTNIVVNLEKKCIDFQRGKQEGTGDDADVGGVSGWLRLKPAYKSAWIIDGQHRLFAFSGHSRAKTSHLSVLAFEGIPPSTQARLFVDINAKQKSVKPSLLQELYAELHWDAESPSIRMQAIISKVVQALDVDTRSALFDRIQTADTVKDYKRCISLASIFKAIERQGFFVIKELHNDVVEAGVFWTDTGESTLARATVILGSWLSIIRDGAQEWWDLGSAEGGGLAMNDSVTACINLLKSVIAHLDPSGKKARFMSDRDLINAIQPYGKVAGRYLGSLSPDDRKKYRDLRGSQGQIVRTRRLQQVIREEMPEFNPPGLEEHIQLEKQQNNLRAKSIIDEIELKLKDLVVDMLKREYRSDPDAWWETGVPKAIRLEVVRRKENDDNKRGGREAYFDLIDYRNIAHNNWSLFGPLIGFGDKPNSSKEKRTKWMAEVNEIRNQVAHASSGVILNSESITILEEHLLALHTRLADVDQTLEDFEIESVSGE